MIIVNSFQPLTITIKRSILDVATVIDPPLVITRLCFFLEDVVIGFAGLVKAIDIAWTFPVEKYTWVVHFPEEPCLSPDL